MDNINIQYIVNGLIPLIVPVLVLYIKKGTDKLLPSLNIPKLILPLLATGLGVLGAWIAELSTTYQNNFWFSIILGMSGVGVREIINQFNKYFKNGKSLSSSSSASSSS